MSGDLDKAIDSAVREMLDVEPPAGLRRRVLEQLADSGLRRPALSPLVTSTFRWKILLPVTAAALLILALLLPRSTPPTPETTTVGVPQPRTAPVITAPVPPRAVEVPQAEVPSGAARERRGIVAAVASDVTFDTPPAPGFPRVPALSIPELGVSSIQGVTPVAAPGAIATDPIATPTPLAIEPLPVQGRQSQE
jgi:hypothetical protein